MQERACGVEGCVGGTRFQGGYCWAHYMRLRNTGSLGTEPIVRRPKGRTCSVGGCERKHCGQGFCETHLRRFLKDGDPGPAQIEPRRPGAVCSIEGCDGPVEGRGWCNAHYLRWRKYGDPEHPLPEHGHRWRGDAITYDGLHQRLRKARGRAADFACVGCGEPAEQWAYDHSEPEPRTDSQGRPYSLDPDRYRPMCQPCHRRFDIARHVPPCSVEGCDQVHKAKGLCNRHYRRALAAAAG